MTDSRNPLDRSSDAPTDLTQEREAFLRTFLKKGVELTEDLIRDNQQLRDQMAQLEVENSRLRAQLASEDVIRELLVRIDVLEQERRELSARSKELEQATELQRGRYAEAERELHDLANLYVASVQLHATMSARRVVRHIGELLEQLIGVRAHVLYVIEGREAVPLAWSGVEPSELRPQIVGEGPVGDVCLTGLSSITEAGPLRQNGTVEEPLGVIPLIVEGRPVGAISIVGMLEQKQQWTAVDRELFQLLGAQASTAMVAANLYGERENPVDALQGIRERCRPRERMADPSASV